MADQTGGRGIVRFDQHLGVHKVAISVDIVARGVKGALLRLDARAGDQEHHAGVKIDSAAISGAKLLDVASAQSSSLIRSSRCQSFSDSRPRSRTCMH